MRELIAKPKLTKKDQRELNKAATLPPCTLAKPHAERDDQGNIVKPFPVGRQARRDFIHDRGRRDQAARSRIQRQVRKQRTGGVQ
jgi:hypothetical protein